MEKYEADIPKTVLLILPVILSKVVRSDKLEAFLKTRLLSTDPQLQKRLPEENWKELCSSSHNA